MRLWTSIMQVCSSGEWDITEELFLQPVADLCGHRLDAIIDEAQHSYLKAPLRMDACMRLAHLYSEMRQVGFSVTGGEAPIVYRDCGPQLLVLLLERLPPEAFLHAVSECEDLRLDLLWAFFNEADACSQPAEPCCWVRPHPAINPGTRGSRGYNAAMRHKFMSIALFIMNCSRVESRYDTSKVRFCAYFTTCAWAQHSVTFDGLRADAAMLLALDGMMMRQPAAIMSTLLQRGFNADANVDLIASQCTAEILRSLIRLKTRPTHGPGSQLLDDILDVLDFPHLVKLADSSFAPCCSVTLQPVHVADYSLYDTYSGPRLHASVRASSEPFLVDVYLTRVQSRFNQDWNEFIIDKDVALTGSKTPHLQVCLRVTTAVLPAVLSAPNPVRLRRSWSGTSHPMPAFTARGASWLRRPDKWCDNGYASTCPTSTPPHPATNAAAPPPAPSLTCSRLRTHSCQAFALASRRGRRRPAWRNASTTGRRGPYCRLT